MGSPKLNQIIKQANEKKSWIVIGGISIILILLLGAVFIAKYHHEKIALKKQSSPHFEPFSQVSEFSKSATGEAIGNLQTSESDNTERVNKLEKQNKTLNKQNHLFMTQLKSMSVTLSNLQKKIDSPKDKAALPKNLNSKQPQVVNVSHAMQSNMGALSTPHSISDNTNSNAGISDFSFQYINYRSAENGQSCRPENCVLPGTFARAVLLGAADANASVNGQSNTTPILFKVLGQGILPNGYHVPLKGCFVVGEVYGDISSERGEVKLAQISCVMKGKTITKSINGTAYFLGKEGIRGKPVMRNGQLLWNAGVAGLLNGLAQGVQQASQTQSISPLGQTATVPTDKIGMAMGAGGIQSAANTLANYYVKRADQYHPIIELNAGTIVNLVFLNKFLLTPSLKSKGALVTKHQSNHYWRLSDSNHSNGDKDNLRDYEYGDSVALNHINHIQQQINALGGSNHD